MTDPLPEFAETHSGARAWWFPVACIAALGLVLLAYSNSLDNSFHFDDSHVIVTNPYIQDPGNIPGFFANGSWFSTLPSNATYRPIVSVSLAIDYWIGRGLAPRQFHITQVGLLCLTGLLLALLFRRLLETACAPEPSRWYALLGATLFCVHTGNTQPVNYISARSELLSGLGVLGTLLAYVSLPRWRRYGVHLLPMVFGVLAKTPAVIAAPLLLACRLLIEEQLSVREVFSRAAWSRTRGALRSTAPAFLAALALYLFAEGMNPPGQSYGGGGRLGYLMTQCWVWVHYFRLFLLPNVLSADTDMSGLSRWGDPRVLLGIGFIAGLGTLCWFASRRAASRPAAFGIAWFAIALVPSSSIFPIAEVTNDHRPFIPFMGLALAAVSGASLAFASASLKSARSRRILAIGSAVAVLVLTAHVVGTLRRNRAWKTEETLWADVVRKSPQNGRGLMNYGLTQMALGRYDTALQLFNRAEVLLPAYATLQINLGIVENARGNLPAASEHFSRALTLSPNSGVAHQQYARWLVGQWRADEAIPHLERAIVLAPADLDARHMLLDLYAARGAGGLGPLAKSTLEIARMDSMAAAYSRGISPNTPSTPSYKTWFDTGVRLTANGHHAEAAQAYRAALGFDPGSADAWNNLGWSLAKVGFYDDALPALESALRFKPSFSLAANNLAWARAQVPSAHFLRAYALIQSGRDAEAVPIYRELLASAPAWTNAHFNLGCALLTLGRFAEARTEFMRTIELQPDWSAAHVNLATCMDALGQPEQAAHERDWQHSGARPPVTTGTH